MRRMGFLANATHNELIQWITEQTQKTASFELGNDTFVPGRVQECVLPLMHDLALRVSGTLQGRENTSPTPFVSAEFIFTPVGRGPTTEVLARSDDSILLPYFVEIGRTVGENWPMALATMWFDQPPRSETSLSELQLLTDFGNFEIELDNFVRSYTGGNIRYVSVYPRRDRFLHGGALVDRKMQLIDPNRLRSWDVRLDLEGAHNPWNTMIALQLDVETSRLGGRYPVLLNIVEMSHYAHLESVKFAEDFIQHCKRRWEWASTIPEPLAAPAQEPAPSDNTATGQDEEPVEVKTPISPQEVSDSPPSHQIAPEPPPWEKIPDLSWDREALRLWWEGHTHKEIAQKLHLAEKTVLNRLSSLRKTYGEKIVITERKRRRR